MKLRAAQMAQKKAKGKGEPVNFSREMTPRERARQIVKGKTDVSQLTDQEIRELVFLWAKSL